MKEMKVYKNIWSTSKEVTERKTVELPMKKSYEYIIEVIKYEALENKEEDIFVEILVMKNRKT